MILDRWGEPVPVRHERLAAGFIRKPVLADDESEPPSGVVAVGRLRLERLEQHEEPEASR